MKFYRVKHIPTGLYYQPVQSECNLSLSGKVYQRPPVPHQLTELVIEFKYYWRGCEWFDKNKRYKIIIDYFKVKSEDNPTWNKKVYNHFKANIPESDWQIEELTI